MPATAPRPSLNAFTPVCTSCLCSCPLSSRYWLLFIDDYLRYFWIYLRKKSEMFNTFKQINAMVKKQFDKLILCLHDDTGGKFIGIKCDTFFAQHSIWSVHMVKVMLQQNGVAEHLNCTLKELLVAMLNGAHLPARFWGEGLNYLCHVIVRGPLGLVTMGTTPYKMVHKCKPNYSPLRMLGCHVWVHIQCKERKSLQDHAKPCIFLGCPKNFKGWKLWDLSTNGGRGGIIVSHNVVWNSLACCVSHTMPFPSALADPMSLVMPSAHQMTGRSLTEQIWME
jgi:hypothetical protein